MRQIPHPLRKLKPLQNRPARRIQTVAAYFLARKFFPVEHDRSQPGEGAKSGTARSGRSTANDCNVEKHFNSMLACHLEHRRDIFRFQNQRFLTSFGMTKEVQWNRES